MLNVLIVFKGYSKCSGRSYIIFKLFQPPEEIFRRKKLPINFLVTAILENDTTENVRSNKIMRLDCLICECN